MFIQTQCISGVYKIGIIQILGHMWKSPLCNIMSFEEVFCSMSVYSNPIFLHAVGRLHIVDLLIFSCYNDAVIKVAVHL